jgi:hypothetical protein
MRNAMLFLCSFLPGVTTDTSTLYFIIEFSEPYSSITLLLDKCLMDRILRVFEARFPLTSKTPNLEPRPWKPLHVDLSNFRLFFICSPLPTDHSSSNISFLNQKRGLCLTT